MLSVTGTVRPRLSGISRLIDMHSDRQDLIDAARGLKPADTVFKNATIFNPFSCNWERGDLR